MLEQTARYTEIARLIWKYRNAGIFSTAQLEVEDLGGDPLDIPEGKPEEFANDLEAMGPTFVKMGQAMSTRPDLIPSAYSEALRRMQDDVGPVPFEEIRETVESELGVRLSKAFLRFDERPLASASLGQVHRAVLRSGIEVAVKVQRPGITQQVLSDLEILESIATTAENHSDVGHRYGFSQWVEESRRSLLRELNYEVEARNLATMADHLEQYEHILVPLPVWDYSTTRVLTMEYLPGRKITQVSGVRKLNENWFELAEQLTRAYLDQIFIHGFIHVDPHPGNVLLTDDGDLALLDLGMVTHLVPAQRNRMFKLLSAVVEGRGEDAAITAANMGTELEEYDHDNFVNAVGKLVGEYAAVGSQHGEGRMLLELTRLSAEHGLRPPPSVALLGKALLNLESLAEVLAPELDLRGVVSDHMSKVMRNRALKSMSPSSIGAAMLEAHHLAKELPGLLSKILNGVASSRLKINVDVFDENRFMDNLQKIANRISVSLILAALIVGAAMIMNIETSWTIFGYPGLAMLMFGAAGLLGFVLVITILWKDRKQ